MSLHSRLSSAVCLVAFASLSPLMTSQAFAQDGVVQLPTVAPQPGNQCFPDGKAPDIVGLSVGMVADDVGTVLEQRGFQKFETKEFKLDGPLADLPDSDVKSTPYEFYRHYSLNSDAKNEEVELWIAPPISGSVIYQITRTLVFKDAAKSPQTSKVDSGLSQKYGDWNEGGNDMCWTYSRGERVSKAGCFVYQDWANMLGNEVDAQMTVSRNTANDKTSQIKTIEYCALTERVLRNDWKSFLKHLKHPSSQPSQPSQSSPAPAAPKSGGVTLEF